MLIKDKLESKVSIKYFGEINNKIGIAKVKNEDILFSCINNKINNTAYQPKAVSIKTLPITYINIKNRPTTLSPSELINPNRYKKKTNNFDEVFNNQVSDNYRTFLYAKKCDNKILHYNILIPSLKNRLKLSQPKYLRELHNIYNFEESMKIVNSKTLRKSNLITKPSTKLNIYLKTEETQTSKKVLYSERSNK